MPSLKSSLSAICLLSATLLTIFPAALGEPKNPTKKAADAATQADPAPAGDKLNVDSIEPLFLDATTQEQGVHLHGTFPQGTDVKVFTPKFTKVQLIPYDATQDLFVNVTVADATVDADTLAKTNKVFLKVVPKQGSPTLVSIDVVPVTSSCPFALTAGLFTPAPTGCPDVSDQEVNDVTASCSLPPTYTFAAFNAATRKFTELGDENFCNSSQMTAAPQKQKKRRKAAKETAGADANPDSTYRKTGDLVQFVVCNKNPFLASTDFSMSKTPIANDDLTTFLGLLVPGLGAGKAANAANAEAKIAGLQPPVGAVGEIVSPGQTPPPPPPPPPPEFKGVADPIQSCMAGITAMLNNIDAEYGNFRSCFLSTRTRLLQSDKTCSARLKDAVALSKSLSNLDEDVNAATVNVNQEIAALQSIVTARTQSATNGPYSGGQLTKPQLALLKADSTALTSQACISNAASDLVSQAFKGASWLDNILGDTASFVEETDIQAFDPTIVTWSVKSSPPSTNTGAILATAASLGSDPYAKCSPTSKGGNNNNNNNNSGNNNKKKNGGNQGGNPPDQNNPANPSPTAANTSGASIMAAERSEPPVARAGYRLQYAALRMPAESDTDPQDNNGGNNQSTNNNSNNNNNNNNGSKKSTTPQSSAPAATGMTYSGTYTFGAPRVVVSAGVAAVVGLQNRQYQKVQANGQTSGTTIEYSTNSSFRMSPLIMAHGRLYQYHEDDSIWATLGVTASSNNSGVSAEYFLGVTGSFLHNWVFLTPGLYIGQVQSLTGGYKVGDQLPSSFTGNIPVQQSYKPGFGLAISFRVPGTSAPKNKTTNQNGNSTNGNNTSNNSGKGSKGSSSQ